MVTCLEIPQMHLYVIFKCMFYAVILVQSPPYDKKFNEKNRELTLEMSLLVMCHIMIVCYVRVGIVVFTLVPGR